MCHTVLVGSGESAAIGAIEGGFGRMSGFGADVGGRSFGFVSGEAGRGGDNNFRCPSGTTSNNHISNGKKYLHFAIKSFFAGSPAVATYILLK
jgi:hypothetical protein